MSNGPSTLDRLRRLMASGDYLAAYDLASGTQDADGPDDLEVRYLAVLALARSGATTAALAAAAALDPGGSHLAEDVAALGARLEKDLALRLHGAARVAGCASAAQQYEDVFRRTGGVYPGVNAAAMWFLAGDPQRAEPLARAVLALADGAEQDYWTAASAAEAALVLGDLTRARASLLLADRLSRDDLASRATTRRQLALLCRSAGHDPALLELLANPTVLHFAGHRSLSPQEALDLAPRLDTLLEEHDVGIGFGSLAAGADVLVAEALLRRGAELHVVLPFDPDDFERASVADRGEDWTHRYRRCLARAASVTRSSDEVFLGDPVLFDLCSRVAMGSAVLRARVLASPLLQVAVWDGRPSASGAGTAVDVERWGRSGHRTVVLDGGVRTNPPVADRHLDHPREVRAMLFCDVGGFGTLTDAEIPDFMDVVMARLGGVLDRLGDAVLLRQTWGDALYVVLRDVTCAVRCALDLQRAFAGLDLPALGLGGLRGLRVAGHVGPLFRGRDHVRDETAFYGSAVVRAARIEPRTPLGEVYVTAQFAALAALEGEQDCSVEYVGVAPTAKGYGDLPMFVVRER
jgi:hypothetical protein